jgi:hypothetical protein
MDLKVYYQRMRQVEESIQEPCVVLVSLETPDGGKAGVCTEVPRELAARHIVDGRARLASDEESREFRAQVAAAKKEADRREAASRIHFAVLPESELGSLKGGSRSSKQ